MQVGSIPLGHPGRTIKQAIARVALVSESQGGKVDSLSFIVLSLGWLYGGGGYTGEESQWVWACRVCTCLPLSPGAAFCPGSLS